ncbi:tetratricopeptide repeat protein [uncultured Cohaesibacter sp.]|uniref:tetratricopeptide repeat protein n=1 Tax=uncultured Cohaesibacter sp. TaxID=1002546 RepID=UPI0029C7C2A5|nr:tetratricopeptide repeat protein [uncultured Cohaesibacter sp.]
MKARFIDRHTARANQPQRALSRAMLVLTCALLSSPAFAAEEGKLTNVIEITPEDPPKSQSTTTMESKEELPNPATSDNPFDVPRLQLSREAAYSAYQRGYYLTAFDFAIKLAGGGDAAAQTLLGELYYRGLGVDQDIKEAANWFKLAADDNNAEAQFALGLMHARGQGVDKDLKKALDLFEKAAAQGQKHAQFNLGLIYLEGQLVRQDMTKAMDLLTKSANQGLPDAQYTLANLYRSKFFPTPKDDQAAYWMLQAAKNGFSDAQLEYGLMLFSGKGVTQDYDNAKAWIEQAAKAGHVLAQNRLARILARGYGAPPEPIKAAEYYLLSKRAGKHDDWLEDFYVKLAKPDKDKALAALSRKSLW